jgi:hypothetical protein
MDERERRMAQNETLFREVNERIKERQTVSEATPPSSISADARTPTARSSSR